MGSAENIALSVSPAGSLGVAPGDLAGRTDAQLAKELRQFTATGAQVLIVANKFTVALFHRLDENQEWIFCCVGELGETTSEALKALVKSKKLLWASTDKHPASIDRTGLSTIPAKVALINSWMKEADEVTGREGHASPVTKLEVAYLAANRCQFSGCGKDLGTHATTGYRGQFSYFAHIVGASIHGPRGDPILSKLLADTTSNFLLLCDECHRLIDKVNPAKYTVEILREMREHSIAEVKRLLANLTYPEVETLVVLGNVTGQMPHFSTRDAEEALSAAKLRTSANPPEWFFHQGGQHHAPHDASYWSALFRTLQLDLNQIQAKLSGVRRGGVPRPPLAVFPFHGTSLLLLAGRVLGDMPGTYLFQPHRNKVGDVFETRWAWPKDATEPAEDKYKVRILKGLEREAKEATLMVSLTFAIEPTRLAEACVSQGALTLPTVEIYVNSPSSAVIRHPKDLMLFGVAVDKALQTLQDEWHIPKVHLYVGAPTTAVLTVGQKMQARNQASFVCYEAAPGGVGSQFKPTIEISSTQVRGLISDQAFSLQP